jgi:AraC-like DNA-binding protein
MSNQRYSLEPNPEDRIQLKLLYVTSAKYEGDWHSTPHAHHFSEFFYVVGGKGRFLVSGHTFEVEEHDLVIVNPNVAHTELSLASNPLEYIALGVEGVCFDFQQPQADAEYRLFSYREQPAAIRQEFLFYLRALLKEAERDLPYQEIICQDLLEVLVVSMIRHTNFTLSVVPSKKANMACAQAKRYIDQHFRETMTLEELSELAHVNKYHLVHTFTHDYGLSPIQYLISRQVEEAKNLLKTTDHSISEIANFTGFASQSYFAQTFQKSTGVSPSRYRRQAKNL